MATSSKSFNNNWLFSTNRSSSLLILTPFSSSFFDKSVLDIFFASLACFIKEPAIFFLWLYCLRIVRHLPPTFSKTLLIYIDFITNYDILCVVQLRTYEKSIKNKFYIYGRAAIDLDGTFDVLMWLTGIVIVISIFSEQLIVSLSWALIFCWLCYAYYNRIGRTIINKYILKDFDSFVALVNNNVIHLKTKDGEIII